MAAIVSEAVQQTNAADDVEDPLRLIWFLHEGPDADFNDERLRATLYGIKDVIYVVGDKTPLATTECLYAAYALFEAYRENIDGVITSNPRGEACLYLNDRSSRYERLRSSRLASAIGVFDPIRLEARGWHLLLEPLSQRPSEEEVKAAITRKYGVDVTHVFNFIRHYAETHVPVGHEPDSAK